jgi:hypothetical protein
MAVRKFDPLKDSLPYHNGSFKFKVGATNCSVLCGGISYTALDYFEAGIAPPKSPKIPMDGNPMEEYLYRRQVTAHFYTWNRFAAAWSGGLPLLGNLLRPLIHAVEQDSMEELAKWLATRPVILCLYGGIGHGHHVVAADCNPGKKEIYLYDSNFPGRTSVLRQLDDSVFHSAWLHEPSGARWRGWFIDWGHYTNGTRMPPLAFRYCRTCHGLNTASLGVPGGCVNGAHNNHPDFEYFLPWQPGQGQNGWKVCGKCQGLYRQNGGDAPFCPALGMHTPQKDNTNWQELRVATGGPGETGWRRCTVCTSLFFAKGNDFGKCTAGGAHTPAAGESYVVDCRTV